MSLTITALYAGLAGLLLLMLAANVVRLRRARRIGIGDGGDPQLTRAIRAHANAIENVPVVLLLMALAEAGGQPGWLLHGLGLALVLGRVLHAWGLTGSAGLSLGRFVGMLLTWASLAGGALAALQVGLAALRFG